ncbi:MAG TPA: alpha/beta hydrolase domain-containing protein [Alphaproteobacteria bacterium]
MTCARTAPDTRRRLRSFGLATLLMTAVHWPAVAGTVPNPIVSGPIAVHAAPGDPSHDYPQLASQLNLAKFGYVEEEFFFEGTANRYNTPTLTTGSVLDSGHPYKTRMIVRRPMFSGQFNGTVLVEWVNVTSGYNFDAMWELSYDHLMREGYAYVGVSAQRVGVQQPPYGLTAWSPVRYGTLDVTAGGTITNDALSYDIFSQASQAIRNPVGVDPLGGLKAKRIIAGGVSQSEGRLVTYYNSIHPLAGAYDAFFLHLGLGGKLRQDIPTKLFKVNTENDVLLLGEAAARQPDSDTLHTWEIAGASHVGYDLMQFRLQLVTRDALAIPNTTACTKPALSHVPTEQVMNAVYGHLVRWMDQGVTPPTAPRIELSSVTPATAVRNSFGNALGGIQLAELAVPTATDTGLNTGPVFCILYGSHEPFDAATLAALYPNHGKYVSQVDRVTAENLEDGYIVPFDAMKTIVEAARSDIGKHH